MFGTMAGVIQPVWEGQQAILKLHPPGRTQARLIATAEAIATAIDAGWRTPRWLATLVDRLDRPMDVRCRLHGTAALRGRWPPYVLRRPRWKRAGHAMNLAMVTER